MPKRLPGAALPVAVAISLVSAHPALATSGIAVPHHRATLASHLTHAHQAVPRHRVAAPRPRQIVGGGNPIPNQPLITGTATTPGIMAQAETLPAPSYTVNTDAQLTAALRAARPGQVIQLASGATFSQISDTRPNNGWVTISGAGDMRTPVIQGAQLNGARYLRFTNVEFTRQVFTDGNPVTRYAAPAENIQVLNSEINCTATHDPGHGYAIEIRGASQNITFSGDFVTGCTVGFDSVAQDNQSQNIAITHSVFQGFVGDAIDLGGLNGVNISDNVIRDIQHLPGVSYHDDGIQFFGNDSNVAITNNVISNSLDQLIFIQDAVKGLNTESSVNSNILVSHNLLYGNSAWAVQDQGGQNVSFVDNTMWDNGDGSLILRRSGYTGLLPANTVVTGNIIQTYAPSGIAVNDSNNILYTVGRNFQAGPGDITGQAPVFTDPANGDFALVAGTIGSGSGRVNGTSAGATASPSGTPATSTEIGAVPPGSPLVEYGAPMWGAK